GGRMVMDVNELACWLALWRLPGVGPALFERVMGHFGALQPLFEAPATQLSRWGLNDEQIAALGAFGAGRSGPLWDGVAQDLEWLQDGPDRHLLTWQHPDYPALLRQIRGAP